MTIWICFRENENENENRTHKLTATECELLSVSYPGTNTPHSCLVRPFGATARRTAIWPISLSHRTKLNIEIGNASVTFSPNYAVVIQLNIS